MLHTAGRVAPHSRAEVSLGRAARSTTSSSPARSSLGMKSQAPAATAASRHADVVGVVGDDDDARFGKLLHHTIASPRGR